MSVDTLALDLEGTLISNAVSMFPRPHLYQFLEFCHENFARVVLFTTVKEERVRRIIEILRQEEVVPLWFESIDYIPWSGQYKDLGCIKNVAVEESLLVDDMEIYVAPGQYEQWVPVKCFDSPYSREDRELVRVQKELEKYLL